MNSICNKSCVLLYFIYDGYMLGTSDTAVSVCESGKEKIQTSTFFSQFFSFLFNDCTTVMNPTASDVEAPSIVCCSISVRAWNIKQCTQRILNKVKIIRDNTMSKILCTTSVTYEYSYMLCSRCYRLKSLLTTKLSKFKILWHYACTFETEP